MTDNPETQAAVPALNVVNIVNKTLNLVDPRLIDHGGRVADLVHRALERRGGYSLGQKRDICLMALLHDIGAYKTEEIGRMMQFETVDIWGHSIYGYLFLKNLSPLADLAPAVFFHHASLEQLRHVDPSYHELAQIIHIADRLDILSQTREKVERQDFLRHFDRHRGGKYDPELVDLFDAAIFSPDAGDGTFDSLFSGFSFSREELGAYFSMVVLSIDFRSSQTVTHTMTATTIAGELAGLLRLDRQSADNIHLGTMLHDLGKQGIPPEILEAAGRLSEDDFAVMKTHVNLTESIIQGNVDQTVVNIAVRHHEKLNGVGYPRGLVAGDLTVCERLVTVADIMSALIGVRSYKSSYPKEKVLGILNEMKGRGELDPGIVEVACDNFDRIIDAVDRTSTETVALYNRLNSEYDALLVMSKDFGKGGRTVLEEVLRW